MLSHWPYAPAGWWVSNVAVVAVLVTTVSWQRATPAAEAEPAVRAIGAINRRSAVSRRQRSGWSPFDPSVRPAPIRSSSCKVGTSIS